MTPKLKTFLERGFSTVVLLSLLGGTVAWNEPLGYALLICVLCNLTSWEWFNMLKGTNANRARSLIAGLVYPWMIAGVALCPQGANIASIPVVSLGCLVLYTILAFCGQLFRMDYKGKSGAEMMDGMGLTLLSFIYPVWMFSFVMTGLNENGIWPMLWLILFTKMSDIWAYVSGVLMGGKFFTRKFSPSVSPKKTWEGIIGSIIITLTVGAVLLPVMGLYTWEHITSPVFIISYIPFGLLLFFLSVWGDLAGSLIKRGLAVKDSGSLLPGIGGIFDLIDSPAFTVSVSACVAPMATVLLYHLL